MCLSPRTCEAGARGEPSCVPVRTDSTSPYSASIAGRARRRSEVFYAWQPNLPDEADNHLIELAVAAQADANVTRNLRNVARGELKFPTLRLLTPEQCLEAIPCPR
jgi:hypothetical protein